MEDNFYYGNGKLLLTGEYFVLDGAKSIALPTKLGQRMHVKYQRSNDPKLHWKSFDETGKCWFETSFELWHFNCLGEQTEEAEILANILRQARSQNVHFLRDEVSIFVETVLEFPLKWGLGSSSTLIYNIAQWAYVSPFELHFKSFKGSGYDIACAQSMGPITYQVKGSRRPSWETISFNPLFKDNLYFIYLNEKQNSRDAIKQYEDKNLAKDEVIGKINNITEKVLKCIDLKEFEELICEHENIISDQLGLEKVKDTKFSDYWGEVKSLGAWGGDFVLATSTKNEEATKEYFKQKGHEIVLTFEELILQNFQKLRQIETEVAVEVNTKMFETIEVSAPSNIAFVKYWGKYGRQLPMNSSVSMTLKNCVTICQVEYLVAQSDYKLLSYSFEGQENEKFSKRINDYLHSIMDVCPFLKNIHFKIQTKNTFPHSAGIASSASAFAALGFAIATIESKHFDGSININKRASELARLGSGSACRSLSGSYMTWGSHIGSNDFASDISNVHLNFLNLKDCILLIDKKEKSVSSSAGHSLMENHPFREQRVKQANINTDLVVKYIQEGNFKAFGKIIETEALTLHALMMSSSPSFILLKPNSLEVIERVKQFRLKTSIDLFFTIDAGPNIHLIYQKENENMVESFIERELKSLCHNGDYIIDECGEGAAIL